MSTEDLISRTLEGQKLYDPANKGKQFAFVGFSADKMSVTLRRLDNSKSNGKSNGNVTDYSLRYFLQLELLGQTP